MALIVGCSNAEALLHPRREPDLVETIKMVDSDTERVVEMSVVERVFERTRRSCEDESGGSLRTSAWHAWMAPALGVVR